MIPCLAAVGRESIPKHLVRFDDLGRGRSRDPNLTESGLHFYTDDRKFAKVLSQPASIVGSIRGCKVILTPDVTISAEIPPWRRVGNTSLSRAAGVVWESRGFTVIPSLRWRDKDDYDYVASGIPTRSIFAVSTLGSVRDKNFRHEFKEGLLEMIRRLSPQAVMVHGTGLGDLNNLLSVDTEFIYYPTEMQLRSRKTTSDLGEKLFLV